jgi:hypothetical protein
VALCAARIDLFERVEGFIQRQQIVGRLRRDNVSFVDLQQLWIVAALACAATARSIDEDLPHQPRGDGVEMRAILPLETPDVQQPQVGFVDECRGLQRLARALVRHLSFGQPGELLVDDRNQGREGVFVARAPGMQQFRHTVLAGHGSRL